MTETTHNPVKVLNKKRLPTPVANSVYIGRSSIWGNPFVIGKDGSRSEVVAKYEHWVVQQPQVMNNLHTLRGKHLVCWCAPSECHGDVLLRLGPAERCD